MSNSRIILEERGYELWDEKTEEFYEGPVLKIRVTDREQAEDIAELVAEEFGEKIDFKQKGGEE